MSNDFAYSCVVSFFSFVEDPDCIFYEIKIESDETMRIFIYSINLNFAEKIT